MQNAPMELSVLTVNSIAILVTTDDYVGPDVSAWPHSAITWQAALKVKQIYSFFFVHEMANMLYNRRATRYMRMYIIVMNHLFTKVMQGYKQQKHCWLLNMYLEIFFWGGGGIWVFINLSIGAGIGSGYCINIMV